MSNSLGSPMMRPDLYCALALVALLVGCGRSSEIRGIYVNQDGAGTLFPCDDARIKFSVPDSALQARYQSLTLEPEPVFVRLRGTKSRSGSPKGGGQRHVRVQEILEVRARAPGECPNIAQPIPQRLSAGGLQFSSGQAPGLHVDAKRLKPGVDTLAVFLIRGSDTTRTGTIVDVLRAEQDQLVRVYSTTDAVLGNGIDTIVSSLDGLRPRSYATYSASRIARLSFQPSEVQGWTRLPNGDSVTIQQALPADVFDGSSFDLILRASSLGPEVKLAVPAFLLGSNTVTTLTGSVTGTETVDQRPCWVVKANFAGMPVTFWIDKETRRLRRQLMQPRADMAILFATPKPKAASGRAT